MNKLTYSIGAAAIITAAISCANANNADAQPHIDEQTLQLSGIEKLAIKTFHADVVINHIDSADSRIYMQQTLLAGSSEDCLYQWDVDNSWGKTKISLSKQESSFFDSCSVVRKISIDLGKNDFSKVHISHHHGAIKIDKLDYNNLELDSHHGQFSVRDIKANKLTIDKHHATMMIEQVVADSIYYDGSHGSAEILDVTAKLLEAEVSHGSFNLKHSEIGKTVIESAHASVMLDEFVGSSFTADGAHSKLKLTASQSDKVEIENKHGEIHFAGSSKKLSTNNTHGSTYIKQLQQDGFEITSSARHGNIDLYLPEGTTYKSKISGDSSFSNGSNTSNNKIDLSVKHGHSQIIHI